MTLRLSDHKPVYAVFSTGVSQLTASSLCNIINKNLSLHRSKQRTNKNTNVFTRKCLNVWTSMRMRINRRLVLNTLLLIIINFQHWKELWFKMKSEIFAQTDDFNFLFTTERQNLHQSMLSTQIFFNPKSIPCRNHFDWFGTKNDHHFYFYFHDTYELCTRTLSFIL